MNANIHIPGTSSRDWVEDFPLYNGTYLHRCVDCGQTFFGHKSRPACKTCDIIRADTDIGAALLATLSS